MVVFDPLDEYRAEGFKSLEHRAGGLDAVRVAMRDNWAGFRLAYVPPAGKEAAALSGLSRLLMKAQTPFFNGKATGQVTLVVEEMNLCFPVSGGVEKAPGFADVCSRGRHYGIEVVGVSQRIAEVATRFRGNCTQTVVFAQKGPRDVAAAASELGCDQGQIKTLQSLSYLHEVGGIVSPGQIVFKGGRK